MELWNCYHNHDVGNDNEMIPRQKINRHVPYILQLTYQASGPTNKEAKNKDTPCELYIITRSSPCPAYWPKRLTSLLRRTMVGKRGGGLSAAIIVQYYPLSEQS